ncbi:MAG: GDSL-type esterase/lipase family protein [Acidobacteriota bacterium]
MDFRAVAQRATLSFSLRPLLATFATLAMLVAPAAAQTRYVAFGDSITNGFGDSVDGDDAGYPDRLERLLADGSTVLKLGFDGEATEDAFARWDQNANVISGNDVMILAFGTNDVTRVARGDLSMETVFFNIRQLVQRARDEGMTVIHATTIPRLPDARRDPNNLVNDDFNQQLRDLAGRNGRRLVDNNQIYSTETNIFSRLYYDGPITDNVGHPNAAGYDLMAQSYHDVIRDIDTVSPVPGILSPLNGEENVDPFTSISVDVWDFGVGVDTVTAELIVNGTPTGTLPSGTGNRVNFNYVPPSALSGIVTVALRVSDLAIPAHTLDRQIARFTVSGTTALQGDVDGDGRVDGQDLIQLALSFGARSTNSRYDAAADLNGDGIVDGQDLAVLGSAFGRGQ